MEDNHEFLGSAKDYLRDAIVSFCKGRVGSTFFADELRIYVQSHAGRCAPGSADRILRDLRQVWKLGYTVVNRRQSLYKMQFVN